MKAIQRILHGIRFVSEHLELLEPERENYNEYRSTSVNFAWYSQKMPPFLALNLFKACCLDCCMIFVLTRSESVTIFIKCFSPILLCFILSFLDISDSKLSVQNLLFVKF